MQAKRGSYNTPPLVHESSWWQLSAWMGRVEFNEMPGFPRTLESSDLEGSVQKGARETHSHFPTRHSQPPFSIFLSVALTEPKGTKLLPTSTSD